MLVTRHSNKRSLPCIYTRKKNLLFWVVVGSYKANTFNQLKPHRRRIPNHLFGYKIKTLPQRLLLLLCITPNNRGWRV